MNIIELSNSSQRELIPFNEQEAKEIARKGWSYSYVYDFLEIRNIYLVLESYPFRNINDFHKHCLDINLPFFKTKWSARRVLEHLNALKNFGFINSNYISHTKKFIGRKIDDQLSAEDLKPFYNTYFAYFRFKEIMGWFFYPMPKDKISFIQNIDKTEILNNSKPLFCFSNNSRFTDSFFYDLKKNEYLYYIDNDKNEDLMRFWDVFIKWGLSLKLIEKFNLNNLEYRTDTGKNIACSYFINYNDDKLDLLNYIKNNFNTDYIYLPELILKIALSRRLRIVDIKKSIIELYENHKNIISFERTSEIFVKKSKIGLRDKIFFPQYDDAFISHLILR